MTSNRRQGSHRCFILFFSLLLLFTGGLSSHAATNYILLGWSESGMQFIDNDFSVFGIHPPGSTIRAQIVQLINGNQARLLTNAAAVGITVTYEAIGDSDGSTNRTSIGKSNFWDYDVPLFGTNLNADQGLGASMPGLTNNPQPMAFETNLSSFVARGIPVTPYDDRGKFNPYPLFKLVARVGGTPVTNISVSLGVTDEMDCRLCHASGSDPAATPSAGWANEPNPERDFRLNILRFHDQRQLTNAVYTSALATAGYNAGGLFAHVKTSGNPILCAKCHSSTIMPGSGIGSIKPLTQAIHKHHASVLDPRDGLPLDSETNRVTCYTCHGGSLTHFLRGAMGSADTTSGQLAIQCQSCHGSMVQVASTNRIGWLSQPNCQACHVGDALATISGQIRFSNALTNGSLRLPANDRFATPLNTPSNGLSLFHLSRGHGNLMCSACHGPAHAESPSTVANDNVRSLQTQGHLGVISECDVCHGTQALTAGNGPHGMHPHDYNFADGNASATSHANVESDPDCRPCHGTLSGTSNQGTILSQARGNRSFPGLPIGGDINFWRGQTIGCTYCHNGTTPPRATNTLANVRTSVPTSFTLGASTNNVRIIFQPAHGLVGISNKVATYTSEPGFIGTDTFLFASAIARKESSLATGTVVVTELYSTADGIPDWWRKLNFGGDGTTTNNLSCATCDADDDGSNNTQEFGSHTDPNDPLSRLRIFGAQATGTNLQVGFQTEVTRQYVVETSANLAGNTWVPVASNLWGRNSSVILNATNGAVAPIQNYRVRTQ